MTKTFLLELIRNGENSGVAFAHNGLAPEFEATDDYLTVRMFRGAGTASGSSAATGP